MVSKPMATVLVIVCIVGIFFNLFYNIPIDEPLGIFVVMPYIGILCLSIGLFGACLNIMDWRPEPQAD